MEKAILRWRRKGAGLRGFQVGQPVGIVAKDTERSDEYEFLSIGRRQKSDGVKKALDRVRSMIHNPEARDQYMRLIMKYQNFKVVITYFLLLCMPLRYRWLSSFVALRSVDHTSLIN